MYNKISDIEDKLNTIGDNIRAINLDLDSNPNVFEQLKKSEIDIAQFYTSVSGLNKITKNEVDAALRSLSGSIRESTYILYYARIAEYIQNIETLLFFLIANPQIFTDGIDEYLAPALELRSTLRSFVSDFYIYSNQPELFIILCDNTKSLSKDDFMLLMTNVTNKICANNMNTVLEKISNRDDEKKRGLTQEIRKKYPNASNKYNHVLLSKNKRNAIKKDFLQSMHCILSSMIERNYDDFCSDDFCSIIDFLSIFFMTLTNEKELNNAFTTHVSLFLAEQFQTSDKKNTEKNIEKPEGKDRSARDTIFSTLMSTKQSTDALKPLPNWLLDDMSDYFLTKKVNGNCNKLLGFVEKILQKLLSKQESVRKEWFKTKITSFWFDCVDDDFFLILEKYGFSCVDICASDAHSPDENDILESEHEEKFSDIVFDEKQELLTSLEDIDLVEQLEWESKKEFLLKKMA